MSDQGREEQIITFPETDGEGTDGQGSPGIIEEKNREAELAESEGSAFDLEGDDTGSGHGWRPTARSDQLDPCGVHVTSSR